MLPKKFERILDENERYMQMLEYYDRTGRFPLKKIRRSYTLKEMNITKLKELSRKTGRSMSGMLDELIEEYIIPKDQTMEEIKQQKRKRQKKTKQHKRKMTELKYGDKE